MSEGAPAGTGWVSVVGWDRFQHYKDRNPLWIKIYTALLSSDDYLQLSLARRGILSGLLLEYARSGCRLSADTSSLSRKIAGRVTVRDLEALNHAGFIEIVASKTLAQGYQAASGHARPVERETYKAKSVSSPTVVRDQDTTREGFESEPQLPKAEPPRDGFEPAALDVEAELERVRGWSETA